MEKRVAELVERLTRPRDPWAKDIHVRDDSYTRIAAIRELGELRPVAVSTLQALVGALGDMDATVAAMAALSLGLIRLECSVVGDVAPIVERLTAALDSRDRLLCSTAAWALGQFGRDAALAIPNLERLLDDEEAGDDARTALGQFDPEAAALALERIGAKPTPVVVDPAEAVRARIRPLGCEELGELLGYCFGHDYEPFAEKHPEFPGAVQEAFVEHMTSCRSCRGKLRDLVDPLDLSQ